ncbi:MAG: hypothetical protein U0525_03085 [Patescibacteria group bacterium]
MTEQDLGGVLNLLTKNESESASASNETPKAIVDIFGESKANIVYDFLIVLSRSRFFTENKDIGVAVAKQFINFFYETSSLQAEFPRYSDVVLGLDELLSKDKELINIDRADAAFLVDKLLEHARTLIGTVDSDKITSRMLSNIYFPVARFFRANKAGVEGLKRLWSENNTSFGSGREIHEYIAQADVHFSDYRSGEQILGSIISGPDTRSVKLKNHALREWTAVVADKSEGERYMQTLVDTLLHVQISGLEFGEPFNQLNPGNERYLHSDSQELVDTVRSKKTELKILRITNKFDIPPQFVLQHLEQFATSFAASTEDDFDISKFKEMFSPSLQKELLYFLLRQANAQNTLFIQSQLQTLSLVISSENIFTRDNDKENVEIVQQLFVTQRLDVLNLFLELYPDLSSVLSKVDMLNSRNPGNQVFSLERDLVDLYNKILPKTMDEVSKYLQYRLIGILNNINELASSVSEGRIDPEFRDSYIQEIAAQRENAAKYLSRLYLLKSDLDNADDFVKTVIKSGYAQYIQEHLSRFSFNDSPKDLRNFCIEYDAIKSAKYFDEKTTEHDSTSKYLSICDTVFGVGFEATRDIFEGNANENLKALGVVSTGDAGIGELKKALTELMRADSIDSLTLEQIKNPIVIKFVFDRLNLSGIQYGVKTTQDLQSKLEMAYAYQSSKNTAVAKELQVDITSTLQKLDFEDKGYVLSDDIQKCIGALRQSFHEADMLSNSSGSMREVLDGVREKIREFITKGEESIGTMGNPKAIDSITQYIGELRGLRIEKIEDIISSIPSLIKKKEFIPIIRAAIIMTAINSGLDLSLLNSSEDIKSNSGVDYLQGLQELVLNHLLDLDEIKAVISSDPKIADKIADLFYVRSMAAELSLARADRKKKGQLPISFVPSRANLFELSGELADACWATRAGGVLLAETYPNVTALIPAINKGTDKERMVGAILLVDAKSADGKPVLILRGLNPQLTFLNTVDCDSFHKALLEYAEKAAKNKKAKLVLPIAERTGQSTTNRPLYFDYLKAKYGSNEHVELDPNSGSTVNGYDITQICRLVADYS